MRIAVIGTGYVGLVSGTCFAELGFNVTCLDKDKKKIESLRKGIIPIYEPGLDEMVINNFNEKRLEFTTDIRKAAKNADIIFIAVGTPSGEDGGADLKYVYGAAEELARVIENGAVVVTKSTVPVGTGAHIKKIISKTRPKLKFEVVSNPEFLREGCAVKDFMEPDRIVVGAESNTARKVMETLYQPLTKRGAPIVFTDINTAELTKYAANAFLAARIAFVNEIADICERVGANIEDITKGIGYDHRIGSKYLSPGPGYGGSCLPKDTIALQKTAKDSKTKARILDAVIESNDKRKISMAEKIIEACGGSIKNKKIAILGLAFKANTDDVRYSPALAIIPELIEAGAVINAYDPKGMDQAKIALENYKINWCDNTEEALTKANAAVIVTEWDEFKKLDLSATRNLMKEAVIVDLRNLYSRLVMKNKGFTYVSIGRKGN